MPSLRRRPLLACCVQFERQIQAGSSVVEIPDRIAGLGVDGLELRELYWKEKARELPEVRERLRALGLRATYATFTTLLSDDPSAREQLLQDIDDAHALGSELLRVFRGPWPSGDDVAAWRAGRRAIEHARERGVRLALENFVRVPGNRRVEVESALLALGSPNVGTNLDTSNYVLNGEDLIANIEALAAWICYSHLKDVRREGAEHQIVPLGLGELPFDRILALYDQTGRDFPVTLEHGGGDDPEAAIATSVEHLRRLGLPG